MSDGARQILDQVIWVRDGQVDRKVGRGRDLVFVQIPETVTPSFTRYLTDHLCDRVTDRRLRLDEPPHELAKPALKLYRGFFRHFEWQRWRDNAWLITFLCDPVRRIVGQYQADRDRNSPQRLRAAMDPAMRKILRFARRASLEEYVLSEDPQLVTRLTSLQTRAFSSFPAPEHPQFLSTAVRNLQQEFLFFGIAEDYETSIQMARIQLGSTRPYCSTAHRRPRSPGQPPQLTDRALDRIQQLVASDRILYDHARRIFRQRRDAILGREVSSFRRAVA